MIFRVPKAILCGRELFFILLGLLLGCALTSFHPTLVLLRQRDFNEDWQTRLVNIEWQREIKCTGRPPSGNSYQHRIQQQIEPATLPKSWNVSQELIERLAARKKHLIKVCHEVGLDKPSANNKLNSREYLINGKYNLIWCNVFKAASSTWFWNFNLLAGYTEKELLSSRTSPSMLARKRYSRPSINALVSAQNKTPKPLSFIITRHPLLRLASAYRNKIEVGNMGYVNLFPKIFSKYSSFGPPVPIVPKDGNIPKNLQGKKAPSFSQFVQYVLDEEAASRRLDMHWIPFTRFCTPCLFNFTVLAKAETLHEDGNYIIFTSGINKVIRPKLINRSTSGPTAEVGRELLCQLTTEQFNGLLKLYKYDLELFQYESESYRNCSIS